MMKATISLTALEPHFNKRHRPMMTEHEWEMAEKRDPTKVYVEPPILPSYKWSMRLGWVCFIAIPVVTLDLIALGATAIADMESEPTLVYEASYLCAAA